MKKLFSILLLLILLSPFTGKATHIVGGEMYYQHLGNGKYLITLIVYRDCFLGQVGFDAPANLTIYSNGNTFEQVIPINTLNVTKLPSDIYDSCFSVPSGVCVERGFYQTTVNLSQRSKSYTISWQRCCRNNSIKNIPNPGGWGSTVTTTIKPRDTVSNNSSPVFVNRPPLAICLGSKFKFDNSATDKDGDSLVYQLCEAIHGADTTDPKPSRATAPPYQRVQWRTGYSASNPIDGNPAFKIDSKTGWLTGTPIKLGQYVFAVCVSEYRNGKFIGLTRREYQVNIKACVSQTVSAVFAPSKCGGLDLTFTNVSRRSTAYEWDFGVKGINTDTSSSFTGRYVFPDSGTYNVRLIANPGSGCADTSYTPITIYHGVEAVMKKIPDKCITNPVFDFFADGKFQSYTDIKWTFDRGSPDTSIDINPKNINFKDTGRFKITLTYEHKGCRSSITKYAVVYPNLIPDFFIRNNSGCTPLQVQLEDRSKAWTNVTTIWTVDNETYSDSIKRLTFTEPGEYVISHQAFTNTGCKDTLPPQFKIIKVFSGPTAGFEISETQVSIFDPVVSVVDKSYNRKDCILYFGDENVTSNCNSDHKFTKPGKFKVSQIVKNDNGCTDTASKYIVVDNEFAFFIPSTFTPNNDGLNEVYKPIIVGVKEIEFTIYDRWGSVVFETSELGVGWNGLKKNNLDPCSIGTYVYKIRAKDYLNEFHFYSANVYLVR